MKMRTVIEAGREASPLVNEGLAEIGSKLGAFRQLVEDLSSVKSDAARDSLIAECSYMADVLADSLEHTMAKWRSFDETLNAYRRKFGKVKISLVRDLPGQQVLFDDPDGLTVRQGATGSP